MFEEDTIEGMKAELTLAHLLKVRHAYVLMTMSDFYAYDLIGCEELVNNAHQIEARNPTRYEVKNDIKSRTTGNLAFEYLYKGSGSGLSTTEADIWAHFDGEKFYLFDVLKLREYIRMRWKTLERVHGGDGASLVLIKKHDLTDRVYQEILQ